VKLELQACSLRVVVAGVKDKEENVKLRNLPTMARSGLTWLALASAAMALLIAVERSGTGAAASSLFQSPPSSPVGTPAIQAVATAAQPPPMAIGPSLLPRIIFAVVGAAALVLVIFLFLLRRR